MSRAEVLDKLVDLRRREDPDSDVLAGVARVRAFADLERIDRAGLTVLPCTVHEFIARSGLLVLDPEAPAAHEMVARMLHGGSWWDDPTDEGSARMRKAAEQLRQKYLQEAAELLRALRDIQNQGRAIEAGG